MSEGPPADIIVGVDTHKHTHAAVAITRLGARAGELTIQVSLGGYRELETWARWFCQVSRQATRWADRGRAGRLRDRRSGNRGWTVWLAAPPR